MGAVEGEQHFIFSIRGLGGRGLRWENLISYTGGADCEAEDTAC